MKKVLSLIIVLAIFSAFTYAQAKIGVVNSQLVLQKSKGGKAFINKLKALKTKTDAQVKKIQDEIGRLQKELQSPALNADAREKKADLIRQKQTEGKRFVEDANRKFASTREKEMGKMIQQIRPIVEKIGKSKGFTMIIEMQNLVYFDKTIDITADVIKAYDATYK